jgi:nuclear pore complex protein Nup205
MFHGSRLEIWLGPKTRVFPHRRETRLNFTASLSLRTQRKPFHLLLPPQTCPRPDSDSLDFSSLRPFTTAHETAIMDFDDPLERLLALKRDLSAFAEQRLPNVARLSAELDASIEDLRRLLDRKRKNEASRKELAPMTSGESKPVKIQDVEYDMNNGFKDAALAVADELDLDELEAAKLCLEVVGNGTDADSSLPFKALLRFHQYRAALLECLRLVFQQHIDPTDPNEDNKLFWFERTEAITKAPEGQPATDRTGMWRKCLAGLIDIESFLKKVGDRKQTLMMTGVGVQGEAAEALEVQRLLLTQQHESLVGAMSDLVRGSNYVEVTGFREFFSKAAGLEAALDITYHYLPVIASLSARFGSDEHTAPATSHELHKIFAIGPGQQQWKQQDFKAAAIACWLAEYSARFSDTLADPALRVADRQKAEQDRSDLFMQCVKEKAFHFVLGACKFLKPEVWHDPAKVALVNFLLPDAPAIPPEAPPPGKSFVTRTMDELQEFTEQFVGNMPDVARRLKFQEDDQRRLKFSMPQNESSQYEPDLERFILIMAYAFQDDPEAAHDFWADKDSNLHGFLRWVSQRLPTPRVAAFCELLTSISNDTKGANQAHRFLLDDTQMVSGKLRKTYSVSWSQIFAELDVFATSLRDKPAVPQTGTSDGVMPSSDYMEGVETSIMLEAYLRLTAHICRTSPDARNWLLREQSFHLGDVTTQLASSGVEGRIRASCFNVLSALLTDKIQEVNDGMWVMIDNWISLGMPAESSHGRPQPSGRAHTSEQNYLQRFNENPETATALVNLLTALVAPSDVASGETLDTLPFPENLGAPNRHAGIEEYVDWVVGTVFGKSQVHLESGFDPAEVTVLRHACLDFICTCLATFNEDLVLLANTTDVAVDATIRTSSLATYARLHPFARVMEWLFNNNVAAVLFESAIQPIDAMNSADFGAPIVQTTLKSIQIMNLAMKLQATYFDIVRPIIKTQSTSRGAAVANAALASFDEVVLGYLGAIADVVGYSTCEHPQVSLEALELLNKLASSRKLSAANSVCLSGASVGNRLIGALAPSSEWTAKQLVPNFLIFEFDVENGEEPFKLVKAKAILKMLNSNLSAPGTRPTIAHALLGLQCGECSVSVAPGSDFENGESLFHTIVACAVQAPVAVTPSNLSWLLAVKRGCWEILLKLASSPLTASIVQRQLQDMEPLGPASKNQISATLNPLWDTHESTESEALIDSSAEAIRDFLRVRELFFQYAALVLRTASESGSYSTQDKAASILRGTIPLDDRDEPTLSVLDLFDFIDLETAPALDVISKHLANVDLSMCMRDDPEIVTAYDTNVAAQLFVLKAREIANSNPNVDPQQLDDEVRATVASLRSQNNWRSIQAARLAALESWTELVALLLTSGGLKYADLTTFALQGLQAILPKFEKALGDNIEAAGLLAKLTLSLVPAAVLTLDKPAQQVANTANERLLTAFRVCLKAVTDGESSLPLRDVCYRICCIVVNSVPPKATNGKAGQSQQAKQLLQLINLSGDRLLRVITEDAFSGRGSARVSAVLFLDVLVSLFQDARVNANMLKSLQKLNFVPVLIDMSIGSVASSFQGESEELMATLSYFHTALALLLRICKTADGTQLVLNSGFFDAIRDSRLFSTDPDIGLDIDNPAALKQFYMLLSAVLRVIISIMICRGPSNAAILEQGKAFLRENRFSMQAVFKRTSAVQKTSGPPEWEAMQVAQEFGKLLLVTGFTEVNHLQDGVV